MTHEEYRNTEYWYNLRHSLLSSRGYRCEKCKMQVHGEEFDLHHIDGVYRMFDEDPDNLMVLCRACHSTYHKADYMIPEGIHDFKVLEVGLNTDKDGKQRYQVKLGIIRRYDSKECWCWHRFEPGTTYERRFRSSIGLPEGADLEYAIYATGRALIANEGEFNTVKRYFTKVNVQEETF